MRCFWALIAWLWPQRRNGVAVVQFEKEMASGPTTFPTEFADTLGSVYVDKHNKIWGTAFDPEAQGYEFSMDDNKLPIAYLHGAYFWDCEECGTENFCRAIMMEPDEETERDFREVCGIDDPEEKFPMVTYGASRFVKCRECGKQFQTEIAGGIDDDEEDQES